MNCPVCACYTREDLRHCPTCGESLRTSAPPVGTAEPQPELNLGFGAGLLFGLMVGSAALGWAYLDQRRSTAAAAKPAAVVAEAGLSCRPACRKRCQALWPGRCRDEGSLMLDCVASCNKNGELLTFADH